MRDVDVAVDVAVAVAVDVAAAVLFVAAVFPALTSPCRSSSSCLLHFLSWIFLPNPSLIFLFSPSPSNAVEVNYHNVPKAEDGGDEETPSAFSGQGKGIESSPGAVGTGARSQRAEGQRDERQSEVRDCLAPNQRKFTLGTARVTGECCNQDQTGS